MPSKTCLILIGRAVAVGTEPGDVPGGLTMLDAALCVPATTNRLVALLVPIIQILSSRLTSIHAVKTHAVEVSQSIGLRLQDNGFPIDITASIALRGVRIIELLETANDVSDA